MLSSLLVMAGSRKHVLVSIRMKSCVPLLTFMAADVSFPVKDWLDACGSRESLDQMYWAMRSPLHRMRMHPLKAYDLKGMLIAPSDYQRYLPGSTVLADLVFTH